MSLESACHYKQYPLMCVNGYVRKYFVTCAYVIITIGKIRIFCTIVLTCIY
ncbi:hypothetical protein MMALV_11920 [Candidatus Methanomethylophilus alvi Mx1201]|uniref:Uncharacterized protein n=1 Tax=Methanomethylophilus alvi (strain Mx1201) TaxID=1236689 RepID=M9SE04_METAX|nr:hypothetical protein MMALV_11920 [Candidatus Methanomethylophilus alvi Mx1201]